MARRTICIGAFLAIVLLAGYRYRSSLPMKGIQRMWSRTVHRSYHWQHFDRKDYDCTVDVSAQTIQAAQGELGLPKDQRQLVIPGYKFEAKYGTPEEKAQVQQQMEEAKRQWEENAARLRQEHEANIQRSGFVRQGEALLPNFPRLRQLNAPRVQKLAQQLNTLAQKSKLGERGTAELMLSFVQEIKYRVPPKERRGLYTGGLLTPVEVLAEGYGDCDSKSLLLATLLSAGTPLKVVLLTGCEHMIVGMEGNPRAGENAVTFQGRTYLLCEASSGVWEPGHVDKKILDELRTRKYKVIVLDAATADERG
ncbi:MAG: hypothetical protein HY318_13535 [Armatimonadetes bacterium]|nr:hypothetical protein [Armatimonadota bacterium]